MSKVGILEKILEIKGLTDVTMNDKMPSTEDEKACWKLFNYYNPDLGMLEMKELKRYQVDKQHYTNRNHKKNKGCPKITTNAMLGAHHLFDLLGRQPQAIMLASQLIRTTPSLNLLDLYQTLLSNQLMKHTKVLGGLGT
jgi:hypothetical protein